MIEQFDRISHDPKVMGGKACIKGTRVTVGMLLTLSGEGKSIEDLLTDFPYVEYKDIMQAISYAAWTVDAREDVIISV